MEKQLERMLREIRKSGMLEAGDIVVAGVSGGADSVLLLYLLNLLRQEGQITLYAMHVHHGIRGEEADRDAEFVEALCRRLEVPCRVDYVDVPALAAGEKLTLEEAGRKARYQCLYRELEWVGGSKLAVAHHRDDCAETVLFHLVRGSGLKGMCGIAPVRGKLIRPLLNFRRQEIEAALAECGLSWQEDSTNRDLRYTRNLIRRELIPYLEKELNPDAVGHIASMAEMLREIDAHMEAETDRWLSEYAAPGMLPVEPLKLADPALQGYLIRRRLSQSGGLRDIARKHVEAVLSLTEKNGGRTVCLPGGRRVSREYGTLIFSSDPREDGGMLPFLVSWRETDGEKVKKIPPDPYTKCFDYDRIDGELYLRTRRAGDRLAVFTDGKSQSVKHYMINARIPAGLRDRVPLLMCGDEVLWVVGYRASEKFRVTGDTKRVLLVTAEIGEEQETRDGRQNQSHDFTGGIVKQDQGDCRSGTERL